MKIKFLFIIHTFQQINYLNLLTSVNFSL